MIVKGTAGLKNNRKRRPGVVSVVLVNFRGVSDTIECINNLKKTDWPSDKLEIIVVENGSDDGSFQRLREACGSDTIVLESKKNLGFAGGCNMGASHAKGEFIGFINNDAKPHTSWISAAIETFDSGLDVGAVASKVVDWDGNVVDYVGSALTWYGMGYKPQAGTDDDGSGDDEKDVLFGTGAAMFVRADVFDELGGFDEDFFMFYEDVDLGWRLNLLGYRFRYQPLSLAYHRHHASMKEFATFREEYLLERNALFTLYKNLSEDSLKKVLSGALLLAIRRNIARGELDSTAYDLRRVDDDGRDLSEVQKTTLAGIFAIDQFVDRLPQMAEKRKEIQQSRVRADRELVPLFNNADVPLFKQHDEPGFWTEKYLEGYSNVVTALDVLPNSSRKRILVVTGDHVGKRMAGPAIRAWNIAQTLSAEHDVRLLSTSTMEPLEADFELGYISHQHPRSALKHEKWADIIISQGHVLSLFPVFAQSRKINVVDIYDPMHLEQLEQARQLSVTSWNSQIESATASLNLQLNIGDFFLCASDRQRHFWLGQLAGQGRINAYTYSRDADLDSLIAVAPFGISEEDPHQTRHAIRDSIPGIGRDDKIIVWGGGIYNWFDPGTLIKAVAHVALHHDDIRLFFMGVKHPNPGVPEMDVVRESRQLAESLGILNKNVFFNENWVEFSDRQNYLLDADLGVSTHFQHVETTFSFRTRILDYLWAELPIITTEGDSFGDLVSAHGLGAAVPAEDVSAMAEALERFLYDHDAQDQAKRNVRAVRERFRWSRALEPLVEFCREPSRAADRVFHPGNDESALPVMNVQARPATGLLRDLERVRFYFKQDGPLEVLNRYRVRKAREKEAKNRTWVP